MNWVVLPAKGLETGKGTWHLIPSCVLIRNNDRCRDKERGTCPETNRQPKQERFKETVFLGDLIHYLALEKVNVKKNQCRRGHFVGQQF